MNELPLYLSAITLGLLGSAHCIGMCGGITSALSLSIANRKKTELIRLMAGYHLGRLTSYALAGFIFGNLGWILGRSHPFLQHALRMLAGGMLIAMGLYLSGIWRGLTQLERIGSHLWRRIQPVANKLLPVQNFPAALMLGSLWGWLPCGLVYSSLVWSASQGVPLQSALLMMCFGIGTLPAVLLTGIFSRQISQIIQAKTTRNLASVMMVLFGLWTLPGPHQHWVAQLLL